jgi:hypothetical protein
MAAFPLVFAKLPLAPRTSNHSCAQMPLEANLEGLLPTLLQSLRVLGNIHHDDETDDKFKNFSASKEFKEEEVGWVQATPPHLA